MYRLYTVSAVQVLVYVYSCTWYSIVEKKATLRKTAASAQIRQVPPLSTVWGKSVAVVLVQQYSCS